MRKRFLMVTIGLVLCLVLSVTGFAKDKPVVGVSVVGTEHNWDINAYNGVLDGLKAAGVEIKAFDGERKPQKQVNDLETLYQLKPDAIIIILGYIDALKPVLKKIDSADIPIITVDLLNEYSTCNVSSNNYGMGIDIALKMVSDLKGEGEIGVFYRPGAWVAEVRRDMLDYVLKDFPKIKIVAEQPYVIPGTVPDAMNKVENILKAHPEIDAFWSLFDMPTIGAAMAIKAAGLEDKVKCYGIDGDPKAISMIRSGESAYAATAVQQPYKIGQKAAEMALKVINGEEVPYTIYVDHYIATEENVEEIIQKVEKYKDLR